MREITLRLSDHAYDQFLLFMAQARIESTEEFFSQAVGYFGFTIGKMYEDWLPVYYNRKTGEMVAPDTEIFQKIEEFLKKEQDDAQKDAE